MTDKTLDSVATAARVLEQLADAPHAVGVTELAHRLGTSKARVYRVLTSLAQHGLVDQEHATERYRLGWKLFQLGERAGAQFDVRRLAGPVLQQLRDRSGQSALLSLPSNGEAVVVAAVDTTGGVCITVKPGHRPAPHCTAQGRMALAWATAADAARLLGGTLPAATAHSLVDAGAIRARLALVRQRLWEDAPNEALVGINVVAAPVLREGDVLAGIVGVIGALSDVPSPPNPSQLALVQGAAAALSGALGSTRYAERGLEPTPELRPSSPRRL